MNLQFSEKGQAVPQKTVSITGEAFETKNETEIYWLGSAAAFMITGPATKITNLGAVKIVLGAKRFALYWAFTAVFALLTGWIVDFAV